MDLGTGHNGGDPGDQPGEHVVGIELVVLATMFTLIVLLTGNRF